MLDKVTETSLLFDFYGNLLTEKQRRIMSLYHEENLSLGEIAEEDNVSRQAVHISLKKAEKALNEYEDKLSLVKRWQDNLKLIENIASEIRSIDTSELKEEDRVTMMRILDEIGRID
ncbi:MAG: YlxM family DNA-binding protein [Clostridiales bacterium]|nr:YlxM family DNA-binding protein [Clostridiales bacterium]